MTSVTKQMKKEIDSKKTANDLIHLGYGILRDKLYEYDPRFVNELRRYMDKRLDEPKGTP